MNEDGTQWWVCSLRKEEFTRIGGLEIEASYEFESGFFDYEIARDLGFNPSSDGRMPGSVPVAVPTPLPPCDPKYDAAATIVEGLPWNLYAAACIGYIGYIYEYN